MPDQALLKHKLQTAFPGAKVDIQDPRMDNKHLKAVVIYDGFEGKSRIEQHRMVYAALKEEFAAGDDDVLHALAIETSGSVKEESECEQRL
jgi:stress-induced morphogen